MRQLAWRFWMMTRLALAGSLLLGACSSQHDETQGASPNLGAAGATGEEVSCTDDARVEMVAGGLTEKGGAGFTVTFDSGEPEPPARGDNVWSVTVLDPEGRPLTDVLLVVAAHMPDHGHMSPTTPEATPTDTEGHATISGLNLFMAGVWAVDVSITSTDAEKPLDSVTFTFCVEG